MHVANLSEIAVDGKYTWKDIRDTLRKAYKGGWSSVRAECFGFYLLYPEIKDSSWVALASYNHRDLFYGFSAYVMKGGLHLRREEELFFDRSIELSNEVRDLLSRHEMIQKAEEGENKWVITERGRGLIRQKALRRISKKEAAKKLTRVLSAAKEFNQDPDESHAISRIVLFGSLIKDEMADVGDIDIMIGLSRRYNGMSFDEWMDNDRTMLYWERPSVFRSDPHATREDKAQRRLKKVTPYLSVEPFFAIDQFKRDGVPMVLIFAAEPDTNRQGMYAKMLGVDIGSHQEAQANRMVLAEKLECPDLVKEVWDQPLL